MGSSHITLYITVIHKKGVISLDFSSNKPHNKTRKKFCKNKVKLIP